jgi:hypothetical protein
MFRPVLDGIALIKRAKRLASSALAHIRKISLKEGLLTSLAFFLLGVLPVVVHLLNNKIGRPGHHAPKGAYIQGVHGQFTRSSFQNNFQRDQ